MKNKKIIYLLLLIAFIFSAGHLFAQQERDDDPATWKYFRIDARAQDDSNFVKIQDDLGVDPKSESYQLIVNVLDPVSANHYVVIGDETDPNALRASWDRVSPDVQKGLLNWRGANKTNLNRKKLNYGSVFLDVFKNIKIKQFISPPEKIREIRSTTAYINPYFQITGGEPLGIPIKQSFGFSFFQGTPYSGPLENDAVGAAFHMLGLSVGITTRLKELVRVHSAGHETEDPNTGLLNYNNIFTPKIGICLSYVIPFGNFMEFGYYSVVDSGDYDPPKLVPNLAVHDSLNNYMKNNVLKDSYFNFEFRYPFRLFGSTRAKVYFAKYLGEPHIGLSGRELRVAGSVFDLRIDFMLSNTKRNFQILFESMISNIGEGFSLSSFAMGPSVRLGMNTSGKFSILSVLLNARFKLGDFFDEKGAGK